jgi:hypothetical protein
VTAAEELEAHHTGNPAPYQARAVRWLANQLAHTPQHRSHRYWMGSVHYDAGRWRDAEPYLSSLAKEFPDQMDFVGLNAVNLARPSTTWRWRPWARRALGARHGPRTGRGSAPLAGDPRGPSTLSAALLQGWTGALVARVGAAGLVAMAGDPRFARDQGQ